MKFPKIFVATSEQLAKSLCVMRTTDSNSSPVALSIYDARPADGGSEWPETFAFDLTSEQLEYEGRGINHWQWQPGLAWNHPLQTAIDDVAKQARQCGEYAPGSNLHWILRDETGSQIASGKFTI